MKQRCLISFAQKCTLLYFAKQYTSVHAVHNIAAERFLSKPDLGELPPPRLSFSGSRGVPLSKPHRPQNRYYHQLC